MDTTLDKTPPPNNCNSIDYVVKRPEQRVEELRYWRRLLQKCDVDIERELEALKQAKANVQLELQYVQQPIDTLYACIRIRESTKDIGEFEDEAERQTRKETILLNTVKNDYLQRVNDIDDISDLLEECKENLFDHLKITDNMLLSQFQPLPGSTPGGAKQGPARPAQWNVNPQACEESSRFLQDRIHQELGRSQNLRRLTQELIEKSRRDVRVQRDACLLAFTMRVNDIEAEKKRLKWHRADKEKQIDLLSRQLVGLEQAMRSKVPVRRTIQESGMEKPPAGEWQDMQEAATPHYTHVSMALQNEKKDIQQKMQKAREQIGKMQQDVSLIGCDLTMQANRLAIGTECLKLRDALVTKPYARTPGDWMTGPMFREKPNLPKTTPY